MNDPKSAPPATTAFRPRLLSTTLWLCASAVFGCAAMAAVLAIDPQDLSGGRTNVAVVLSAGSSEDVSGLQFDFNYDPAAYTLIEVVSGPAAQETGKLPVLSEFTPGSARVLIAGMNQSALYDGHVATIVLAPRQANASTEGLAISALQASDPFGYPVEVSFDAPESEHGLDDLIEDLEEAWASPEEDAEAVQSQEENIEGLEGEGGADAGADPQAVTLSETVAPGKRLDSPEEAASPLAPSVDSTDGSASAFGIPASAPEQTDAAHATPHDPDATAEAPGRRASLLARAVTSRQGTPSQLLPEAREGVPPGASSVYPGVRSSSSALPTGSRRMTSVDPEDGLGVLSTEASDTSAHIRLALAPPAFSPPKPGELPSSRSSAPRPEAPGSDGGSNRIVAGVAGLLAFCLVWALRHIVLQGR